jgi:hypothetical protein
MSLWTRIVGVVVALALIGGIGWVVVRGIEKEPALVGSLATAMSAVVAVSVARNMEKRAELRQVHREQMAPLYAQLIERVRTVDQDEDEAAAFWTDLSSRLILYGPAPVIRAHLALSRHVAAAEQSGVPDMTMMLTLERLYRAMRADLGHDDKELQSGDLLRLYVTDIDDLIGPFKPPQS